MMRREQQIITLDMNSLCIVMIWLILLTSTVELAHGRNGKSQIELNTLHHYHDESSGQNITDRSESVNSIGDSVQFDVTGSQPVSRLPERPLQLVRPDPAGHRQLVLVEENIRHLHYVKGGVAVVAVVGKFHSGKSFLLNQLMGKPDGFGVGPTVRPQTMGIWMWGKPQVIETPSGESLSVIYLDTEGFAASNISEIYDAKIFAVSTILSSYLIYNSVKIIDQGDIDYLDLLSRRTRLFALKSQITKSKWFDEFNHDLLQFPPLIWVVQDFVQTTEDEESPQEWLRRIMGSMSRDSEDHNINLLDMFESVNCHTLFLPATKKKLLQDLSNAKEEDLTEEYKEERDQLLTSIHSNLKPKEKNGRPITGPEIASLLSVLVDAANEGSLAEVPSRWDAFIEQLHANSVTDCIAFYESEMNSLLRTYNQGAINATELEMWNRESYEKSRDLLEKLLLGLKNATLKAQENLGKSTKEKFEKIKDINEKKIELRCSETQRRTELKVEEALEEFAYPLQGSELKQRLSQVREKFTKVYREEVRFLADHSSFDRHLKQLQVGIDRIFNGAFLKNKEAMEVILNIAIEKAIATFEKETSNPNLIPRTTSVLKGKMKEAEKVAMKVFNDESVLAHKEDIYDVFLGKYKSSVQEASKKVESVNLQLIKDACKLKASELVSMFKQRTSSKKLSFPINEKQLNERLKAETEGVFQTYADTQEVFRDTLAYIEIRKELTEEIDEICDERRDQNYAAYIKEVETPLIKAKKVIMLSANLYDTPYSFQQYMESVCLVALDDGKAQDWSHSLKMSIITRYLNEQDDLQEQLRSKTGIWSAIKGFFQYIYDLLFG